MNILYSTGCPKCKVLETKLNMKHIKFEICEDVDLMLTKGIQQLPCLEIDGKLMSFIDAIKWVDKQ